ncbi:thioredoxin family protein [candidate division WOR-3 bacterium]|nr:thioredoxin family protein [candidate division WOR-3 bacterium]
MKLLIRIIVITVLAALIFLAIIFGKNSAPNANQPDSVEDSSSVNQNSLSDSLPVLIEFGSLSCVPCKMMVPELDKMRSVCAGKLNVLFVDVYQNPEDADRRNIRVIPTQVFLSETGEELFRHQGFFSAEDMLDKWKELGYVFEEEN